MVNLIIIVLIYSHALHVYLSCRHYVLLVLSFDLPDLSLVICIAWVTTNGRSAQLLLHFLLGFDRIHSGLYLVGKHAYSALLPPSLLRTTWNPLTHFGDSSFVPKCCPNRVRLGCNWTGLFRPCPVWYVYLLLPDFDPLSTVRR